jgi:integrase
MTPRQWYELLNRKVFFWVTSERVKGLLQARRYRSETHTVITVDTASLLERYMNEITLSPINSGSTLYNPQPRGRRTFSALSDYPFIDRRKKRPHVKSELRPSTYKDYKKDVYEKHLKIRLGDLKLRDFRTVNGQRILRDIATTHSDVGHKTLLRIKSFLSGAFKHAKREGFIDGENPMRDTAAPGKPQKFRGPFYTMNDIERMTTCMGDLDDITEKKEIRERVQAVAVMSVAAFAGLRRADYDGRSLAIRRAVWRTHVGETKNPASESSVPVLPILKDVLDNYKKRVAEEGKYAGNDNYIFSGERRGAPLNLANLARRVIIPALPETAADSQGPPVEWKGWHAFRRALATNLHSCGVDPKVGQAILRHSDMKTTLELYTMVPDADARKALAKIEDWIKHGT